MNYQRPLCLASLGLVLYLAVHSPDSVAQPRAPDFQVQRTPIGECIFQSGFECPPVSGLSITGFLLDYWTLLSVAEVGVLSLSPPLIAITGVTGDYFLGGVESFGSLLIKAFRAPGYRETNNVEFQIGEKPVGLDMYIASNPDLARQFASVGISQLPDTAIVIAEMRDSGGSPLEGIPIADVVLADDSMLPIGDGPYFFGLTGDIVDPVSLNVSTAFMGRGARVAFLNVPPVSATLRILLPPPQTNISEEFVAEEDVVHLLIVQ